MRIAVTRADAATLLARALRLSATSRAVAVEAIAIEDRAWASATFEGTRHKVVLTARGEEATTWLADLADAELPIRGHVVVDLHVDDARRVDGAISATLTVLTLAES